MLFRSRFFGANLRVHSGASSGAGRHDLTAEHLNFGAAGPNLPFCTPQSTLLHNEILELRE